VSSGTPPTRGERDLVYRLTFNNDLTHWITNDPRVAIRVMNLIDAVRRDPFRGIGKPEPLKRAGPNTWSRRITEEHRLVYVVEHARITFLRARGHYDD
jgi:toxin YoeB